MGFYTLLYCFTYRDTETSLNDVITIIPLLCLETVTEYLPCSTPVALTSATVAG